MKGVLLSKYTARVCATILSLFVECKYELTLLKNNTQSIL